MKLWGCLRLFWSVVVRRRLIISLVAILAALSGMVWWCGWDWLTTAWWCSWKWLRTGSSDLESGSTTIRNVGLVVGGGIAIWVAYWRSVISQHGLLNERYQKGAQMLGSEVLSVRLGGIYTLRHLAEDAPKQYHVQIMRLLCAFVRNPPVDKDRDDNARPTGTEREPNIKDYQVREDVQEAMTAIGTRSDADVELEKKAEFSLDLSDAYLPFVWLYKANLTDANLIDAKFYPEDLTVREQHKSIKLFQECADLTEANLSNAFLTGANLTNANLSADLSGAMLVGANLTSTFLSKAKGLTQRHLNQACADVDNPPNLDSLRDAETGVPLEWRDKPCACSNPR